MPAPVSKKQFRFMHAIASGKIKGEGESRIPPAYIAEKYTRESSKGSYEGLPDSKDNNRGGLWNHGSSKVKGAQARRDKTINRKARREERGARMSEAAKKEKKRGLKKSESAGVGVIVVKAGKILLGHGKDGELQLPGGKIELNETPKDAAIRELKEESTLSFKESDFSLLSQSGGEYTFLVKEPSGEISPKDTKEMQGFDFYDLEDIPFDSLRVCSIRSLKDYLVNNLSKTNSSLADLGFIEEMEKNIVRYQEGHVAHEISHGDALKLVGNSCFRFLKGLVSDLKNDDFTSHRLDDAIIHIRKHFSDSYSGRIVRDGKVVHTFQNKSLPELTADVMSVFEWYESDEDSDFDIDDSISDETLDESIKLMINHYRHANLSSIHDEIMDVREDIRSAAITEVQQLELRLMGLFDDLDEMLNEIAHCHNLLNSNVGSEIDDLKAQLLELQNQVDELSNSGNQMEGYTSSTKSPKKIHEDEYPYLSRPSVVISPNGKITISFNNDWTNMEKVNYLKDLDVILKKKI